MSRTYAPSKNYGLDMDVKTYANNILLNGGSISLQSLEYVNQFVIGLKTNAIWQNILDMGIFCGNNLNAALVKLKYVSGLSPVNLVNNNFIAGDYVERGATGGLTGNASTKYLDTIFPILSLNRTNVHCSFYKNVQGTTNASFRGMMGASYVATGNTDRFYMEDDSSNSTANGALGFGAIGAASTTAFNGTGFRIFACDGTNTTAYKNTSISVNGAGDQTWQKNGTVWIFNVNGSTLTSSTIPFYSIGYGLSVTDVTNFYNLVQTLQTQLGRQV